MISQIIFMCFVVVKIAIAGMGYVGLSNAIHLAWHNNVIAFNYLWLLFAEHVVNTD